ncbi:GNAT family N-acetyltransferase [Rhizobium sp.]|uniref:GNAT family N-acetyltransferase n=1 Tax=Rhizobium sp. TaxID=391 RepID=UPI0028A5C153
MIETDRLFLRLPTLDDFQPTLEMFSEEAVSRRIGHLGRGDVWARLLRDVGHWQLLQFGLFSVIERDSGIYVGKVGFGIFERDLGRRAQTNVEVSWTLRARFHGRGYASEAATAAQKWFDQRHKQNTACLIAIGNVPSIRLAQRMGYEEVDRITRDKGDAVILMRDLSGGVSSQY